jgi:hypothetical protein
VTINMELPTHGKSSLRSEALAVLLSAGAGSGIGWIIWLATANIALSIGIAGPMAALTNGIIRRLIR